MIKTTEIVSDKKTHEGNIFQFSILGRFSLDSRTNLKSQLEEICQNSSLPYKYKISTYVFQSQHGSQHVVNTIEYHQNISENYLNNNEYIVDNRKFYNDVNFIEKIDDFLIISKYFLKYTTPVYLDFKLGSSNIIEVSRTEENMDLILKSLGYKEKSNIKQEGDFIKYKNLPIIIKMFEIRAFNSFEGKDNSKATNEMIMRNHLIEVIGYCYENEKENTIKLLQYITDKIKMYCFLEYELVNNNSNL